LKVAVKKTERDSERRDHGEGDEEVDGKGNAEERVERAPCSPSDALLKVKVFHPSLVERESERVGKRGGGE